MLLLRSLAKSVKGGHVYQSLSASLQHKMLLFLPILVLFSLNSREIGGQVINLDNLVLETTCTDSLRSGTDQYSFNGTYGLKFLELSNNSGWTSFVTIEILRTGATSFADICSVAMGPTGQFCSSAFINSCYCRYIDTNGTAHISVRNRANFTHSQAIIRGAWQNKNGTNVYSTNNLTLPKIYDPNAAAVLVLSVNDEQVVETSGSCSGSFILNSVNTVKLCCSNTATPCYPRIAFNGTVVAENKSTCAIYTFIPNDESYQVNVERSYSVCSFNNITIAGSCMIETSVGYTTTAPDSTPTITADVTSSTVPSDNVSSEVPAAPIESTTVTPATAGTGNAEDDHIGEIVGGVLGGLAAIVIAVCIGLYCWKTKANKKELSTGTLHNKSSDISNNVPPRNPNGIPSSQVETQLASAEQDDSIKKITTSEYDLIKDENKHNNNVKNNNTTEF